MVTALTRDVVIGWFMCRNSILSPTPIHPGFSILPPPVAPTSCASVGSGNQSPPLTQHALGLGFDHHETIAGVAGAHDHDRPRGELTHVHAVRVTKLEREAVEGPCTWNQMHIGGYAMFCWSVSSFRDGSRHDALEQKQCKHLARYFRQIVGTCAARCEVCLLCRENFAPVAAAVHGSLSGRTPTRDERTRSHDGSRGRFASLTLHFPGVPDR